MFNLAVFVSGRGSNLRAILDSISPEKDEIRVSSVFSNISNCLAVEFAKSRNIPVHIVGEHGSDGFTRLIDAVPLLKKYSTDLIVLAGFLKKIPDEIINEYQGKVINIHPALLPSFGGKGMYGLNVHKAVFESSARVSGVTIHFVDSIYDNGKIIAQKCVSIDDVKTPEDIASIVLRAEHELLPQVIKKIAAGKIIIDNNRVRIND